MVTSTVGRLPAGWPNIGWVNLDRPRLVLVVQARSDDEITLAGHNISVSVQNHQVRAESSRIARRPDEFHAFARSIVNGPSEAGIGGRAMDRRVATDAHAAAAKSDRIRPQRWCSERVACGQRATESQDTHDLPCELVHRSVSVAECHVVSGQ